MGNYGEVWNRNLGAATPLKLERGLNAQWNQGGLLYSPPFQRALAPSGARRRRESDAARHERARPAGRAARWPAALAWILGLGGLAALLALQIESRAGRARVRLRLPVPGLGLSHLGKPARRAARGSLLDVAGGRPGQHADGGAGRPALATLLGVALGLARLSPDPVASRLAAVIIAPLQHPSAVATLCLGTACCCAMPDARQAWEPLPSVLLSNRGLALPTGCRKRRA